MPNEETLAHLTALYAAERDPWRHDSSLYERAKHRRTLAAIGRGPYRSAAEIGCGTGPLTAGLVDVCERVVALDCVPAAIDRARARVPGETVRFVEAAAPQGLPDGCFDLIVLSEVLYFLTADEVEAVARWVENAALPACRVVSVNWTGPTGHAISGVEAADLLCCGLPHWRLRRERNEGYILDVLDRAGSGQA
ncbi:SAM-dependent methyltransferase [Roseitranquillus sediminis]|uniref:SAM-dependent methyltransferase n=1 Tax=Roseitranquillus sediminis TaxID=2809051 RepID=UPI001D0C9FEE|nr:SAM-dependent methyltransferase [Roseitranquillus sediminis]MBM9596239.1 methyltransferase domain-containing protein [Roseitranquillus sediminis]